MGQIIGGILGGAGNIMGGIGQHQSALSSANSANLNVNLSHAESDAEAGRTLRAGRRTTGLNITRVAKSGVKLEGSPLEVLAFNAGEVRKQASRQQRSGLLVAMREKARANQAKKYAGMALAGGIIGGGSQQVGSFQGAS